jgi:hypothetical protein
VIVSPLGDVLAGPAFDEETVLHADLDLDRIAEAKYDFDVVGHYARPDVFTLSVDERPRPPVADLDPQADALGASGAPCRSCPALSLSVRRSTWGTRCWFARLPTVLAGE